MFVGKARSIPWGWLRQGKIHLGRHDLDRPYLGRLQLWGRLKLFVANPSNAWPSGDYILLRCSHPGMHTLEWYTPIAYISIRVFHIGTFPSGVYPHRTYPHGTYPW